MLVLTPALEETLEWFYGTHELTAGDGRVWWRRTSLPTLGGLGDQDGLLMAELEYLEIVMNGLLWAQRPKHPAKKAQTAT